MFCYFMMISLLFSAPTKLKRSNSKPLNDQKKKINRTNNNYSVENIPNSQSACKDDYKEIYDFFENFKADINKYHSSKKFKQDCAQKLSKNIKYQNPTYSVFVSKTSFSENYWKSCYKSIIKNDSRIIEVKKAGVKILEFYAKLVNDESKDHENKLLNGEKSEIELFLQRIKAKSSDKCIQNLYKKFAKKYNSSAYSFYEIIVTRKDLLSAIFPFLFPLEEALISLEIKTQKISMEDVIELIGWLHVININAENFLNQYKKQIQSTFASEYAQINEEDTVEDFLEKLPQYDEFVIFIKDALSHIINIASKMSQKFDLKNLYESFNSLEFTTSEIYFFKDIISTGNLKYNINIINNFDQYKKRQPDNFLLTKKWFYKQVIEYTNSIYNGIMFYEDSPIIWEPILEKIEELVQYKDHNDAKFVEESDVLLYKKLKNELHLSVIKRIEFSGKRYVKKEHKSKKIEVNK